MSLGCVTTRTKPSDAFPLLLIATGVGFAHSVPVGNYVRSTFSGHVAPAGESTPSTPVRRPDTRGSSAGLRGRRWAELPTAANNSRHYGRGLFALLRWGPRCGGDHLQVSDTAQPRRAQHDLECQRRLLTQLRGPVLSRRFRERGGHHATCFSPDRGRRMYRHHHVLHRNPAQGLRL